MSGRKQYRVLLIDLDGVVWVGDHVLWENVEWLRRVYRKHVEVFYVTNNSTMTRSEYAEKLTRILGETISSASIVTSGYAAGRYIREEYGRALVYVIGEEGLVQELVREGHTIANIAEPHRCQADILVVGLDRHVTYQKLLGAHIVLTKCRADFIATNTDNALPSQDYTAPGAGAIIAFLERSSGRKPDIILGKPSPFMYKLVMREYNVSKRDILVIGDRCDTDIKAAEKLGVDSVLVKTGISAMLRQKCHPTYTVNTLRDLEDLLSF